MFIVAGLGNPGAQYAGTRHNAGFWVVEKLANDAGAGARSWSSRGGSLITRITLESDDVILALPQLFMNRSGEALQPVISFFKIEPQSVIVVHDELDLDPGVLRIKQGGGAGGHRGVTDIMRHLGTDDFVRVRVGVGHPRRAAAAAPDGKPQGDPKSWVLTPPRKEEQRFVLGAVDAAADAVRMVIREGVLSAQQRFHSQTWERAA